MFGTTAQGLGCFTHCSRLALGWDKNGLVINCDQVTHSQIDHSVAQHNLFHPLLCPFLQAFNIGNIGNACCTGSQEHLSRCMVVISFLCWSSWTIKGSGWSPYHLTGPVGPQSFAVGQHAVACWTTAALGRWFLRYICCPTHHPLNPTSRVYLLVPWL